MKEILNKDIEKEITRWTTPVYANECARAHRIILLKDGRTIYQHQDQAFVHIGWASSFRIPKAVANRISELNDYFVDSESGWSD